MPAPPTYTLTITPPGGSPSTVTQYLDQDDWSFSETFGRTGTQAVFYLQDDHVKTFSAPNIEIPALSQFSLSDTSGVVFDGVISMPRWQYLGPGMTRWEPNCTDYSVYGSYATVQGDYVGISGDQIICDLTARANCGISAVPVAQGGFVYPAPVIPSITLNWDQLASQWTKVSQQASVGASYGWYVDSSRNLHFYTPAQSPVRNITLYDDVTAPGSTTIGHFATDSQMGYYWDGTSLRTRAVVRGASVTNSAGTPGKAVPTDSWVANGYAQAFPLSHAPATNTETISLRVNGAAATVAPLGTTGPWELVQDSNSGAFFLQASSPPPFGSVIQAWYSWTQTITAQADNLQAQALVTGPNGGVWSIYVADSTLTTYATALARANRELQEYALVQERWHATVAEDFVGILHAGDLVNLNLSQIPNSDNGYNLGISDTFVITTLRCSGSPGGYRTYECDFVRVGTNSTYAGAGSQRAYSLYDFMQAINDQSQEVIPISTGEPIQQMVPCGELLGLTGTLSLSVMTGQVNIGSFLWGEGAWAA